MPYKPELSLLEPRGGRREDSCKLSSDPHVCPGKCAPLPPTVNIQIHAIFQLLVVSLQTLHMMEIECAHKAGGPTLAGYCGFRWNHWLGYPVLRGSHSFRSDRGDAVGRGRAGPENSACPQEGSCISTLSLYFRCLQTYSESYPKRKGAVGLHVSLGDVAT